MKSDAQIQKDVQDQLQWEPLLNAAEIGVAVKNGIVTLSGTVDTYSKRTAAEIAAKKVFGVKAVAEDIQVGVSSAYKKSDTEIAEIVLTTLKENVSVPDDQLQVKVEDGIVTLEGTVEWAYQRIAAKNAIENLMGIRAVYNNIYLKPRLLPESIKEKINAAFIRSATIDSGKITVEVTGSKVTLKGKVRSFTEKEDAANAVWAAPGVLIIDNKLEVDPEVVITF